MAPFLSPFATLLTPFPLSPVSLLAQQGHPESSRARRAGTRKPFSILNQSLSRRWRSAISASSFRTSPQTGKITYFWTEKGEPGTVIVKSRGSETSFPLGGHRRLTAIITGISETMGAGLDQRDRWHDPAGYESAPPTNAGKQVTCLPPENCRWPLAGFTPLAITDLGMVPENGQAGARDTLAKKHSMVGGRTVRGTPRQDESARRFSLNPSTFLVVRNARFDPRVAGDPRAECPRTT